MVKTFLSNKLKFHYFSSLPGMQINYLLSVNNLHVFKHKKKMDSLDSATYLRQFLFKLDFFVFGRSSVFKFNLIFEKSMLKIF